MTEAKRRPSWGVIFADLLVGFGATALTGLAFPHGDVWADWTPWGETPIQDGLESAPQETGPYNPLLTAAVPESFQNATLTDFLPPIVGLGTVFGFGATAISSMIGVPVEDLEGWLTGRKVPSTGNRRKLALLAVLHVQLTKRFEGKPLQAFHDWLATPLAGFGNRCPAQALLEGHALEVVNYLALWSLRDESNGPPK